MHVKNWTANPVLLNVLTRLKFSCFHWCAVPRRPCRWHCRFHQHRCTTGWGMSNLHFPLSDSNSEYVMWLSVRDGHTVRNCENESCYIFICCLRLSMCSDKWVIPRLWVILISTLPCVSYIRFWYYLSERLRELSYTPSLLLGHVTFYYQFITSIICE